MIQSNIDRATFNPPEAAVYIGVSRPTIYNLCSQVGFPAVRIGRSIKIPKAALDRWLDEQAAESKR